MKKIVLALMMVLCVTACDGGKDPVPLAARDVQPSESGRHVNSEAAGVPSPVDQSLPDEWSRDDPGSIFFRIQTFSEDDFHSVVTASVNADILAVVDLYFSLCDRRQFQEAFDLKSGGLRAHQSLDAWVDSLQSNSGVRLISAEVVSPGLVEVVGESRDTDLLSKRTVVTRNRSLIQLVQEGGQWRIDAIALIKKEELP